VAVTVVAIGEAFYFRARQTHVSLERITWVTTEQRSTSLKII